LSYFESRLRLDFDNIQDIKRYLEICKKLAIPNLILEPTNNITHLSSELKKKIENETSLKIYYRINLRLENMEDYKKNIKKFNNFSDILSIETSNKEIQLQAARDSRVDIVSFSDPKILRSLTSGVISLVNQNNSFIEFSLSSIMVENKVNQSKNFRNLYRSIQLVRKTNTNYIISGNFKDPYDLRHPRNLISICHTLLELPIVEAKKAFFQNLEKLILRVNSRNDRDILETGVKLVKGGE
jgi:RNase P/RNase MRP subunit p30